MNFPVEKFKNIETPFYYYDTQLLRQTLDTIVKAAEDTEATAYTTP